MLEWFLHHQRVHLAPLRGRSLERAVERPVDREMAAEYVMLEGTRLPFFTESELRALDEVALRERAMQLHRLREPSKIGTEAPLTQGAMLDWVLQCVIGACTSRLFGSGLWIERLNTRWTVR